MKGKLPNIILIILDTVGAKHMSLYGYHRETTPHLERIADECLVYSRCFAPANWTIPSHASIFSGLYPSQHGLYGGSILFNENLHHIVPFLKMLGYRTLGISSNGLVSPDAGLCPGYDFFKNYGTKFFAQWMVNRQSIYHDKSDESSEHLLKNQTMEKEQLRLGHKVINKLESLFKPGPIQKSSIYSEKTLKLFYRLIHQCKDNNTPFFMFINFMDGHEFYMPPRKYRKFSSLKDKQKNWNRYLYKKRTKNNFKKLINLYKNLYHDEIYYLDKLMYHMWSMLKKSGIFDETVVMITSDHGEHFGEKYTVGHLLSLYNELIWVPLMIKYHKDIPMKGYEDRLVSLNDLYSTISDLIDSPLPRPETSVSLLGSQKRQQVLSQHIMVQTFESNLQDKKDFCKLMGHNFSRPQIALINEDGLKLIENSDGSFEVYDLNNDMDEKQNLAEKIPPPLLKNFGNLMQRVKNETGYNDVSQNRNSS